MNSLFIRRCMNGKTFVAAATVDFPGLGSQKCPFTGEAFENTIKEINADRSEVMGINYEEAVAGVKKDGLFFGKFRINLGETQIIQQ